MEITELLAYSDRSRKLLRETLEQHSGIFDTPFETLSHYSSICKLVAHIAGAEERLVIQRLAGGIPGPRYEDVAPHSIPAVFDDWDRFRAHTHAFIASIDTSGLAGMIPISLPNWSSERKITVEQILFHALNHQNYHLGQISMALQRFGVDPPNFDYILLASELD